MSEHTYPDNPGYKRRGTSEDAADAIKVSAPTIRDQVLIELGRGPSTADEMADYLDLDKLTVRPRFSELEKMGKIEDSGDRRSNKSGKKAIVWRVKPPVPVDGQMPLW